MMRLVIIESPYAAREGRTVEDHVTYARACLRHSLTLGEAPLASHLLYTQAGILSDTDPAERALGIAAGLAWGKVATATIIYHDLGITAGMHKGIEHAQRMERPIEYRELPPDYWPAELGPQHPNEVRF